jgi:ABC-type Zn2+ transport system substrate-binding protein/surface adhesin
MKLSELKKYIEENIVEILGEDINALVATKTGGTKVVPVKTAAELTPLKADPNVTGITTTAGQKLKEAKDEDEEVEDTYGKEDEDDKKDAKIANAEPSKSELKKLDKEFSSTKLAKKLAPADQERLDKLEAGIKKKLANPTKDNIEIVRQLIKKPEIKKLFKDGGKDLKALISDIIR